MKFALGRLVATPGALAFCEEHKIELLALVQRHCQGDWGDLTEADKQLNEEAIRLGNRILSSYVFPQGKVWLITEYDRSVTTVLLPEEY
jgi:hypothetical protein